MHPPRFGFLNPIHLSLGAYLGFELGNSAQHIKEEAAGRISGVDVLIEHLEAHVLAFEIIGNLTQMQGGTRQTIQTRHHQGVAFPEVG